MPPTNEVIREKIRLIRRSKNLRMKDVAEKLGMKLSSYSALENGYCRINVDRLYDILDAIDADIEQVWPAESLDVSKLHLLRMQDLRLRELLFLAEAEAAVLAMRKDSRITVLLSERTSDDAIQRFCFYIEMNQAMPNGRVIRVDYSSFSLFLYLEEAKKSLKQRMIAGFLDAWAEIFSDELILEAAKDRQLQSR
jgi:transcriptional regulator with XRE-family HTH domain